MENSTIVSLLTGVVLVWLVYKQVAPVKGLRNMSADDFKKDLQKGADTVLIDVREIREFVQGSIPNAVNIPLSELKQRVGEIPKDKAIYLFCRSGMRSKQAGRILSRSGFGNMAHLRGGMMAWKG